MKEIQRSVLVSTHSLLTFDKYVISFQKRYISFIFHFLARNIGIVYVQCFNVLQLDFLILSNFLEVCNPTVYHAPETPTIGYPEPVHIPTACYPKTDKNTIHTSTSVFPKWWSLSTTFFSNPKLCMRFLFSSYSYMSCKSGLYGWMLCFFVYWADCSRSMQLASSA
jgi:hypothetical protein